MLSTVFAVLAGLDSPTQGLFSLKPKAMTSAQTLIAQNVHTGSKSPTAFCDGLPVPSFAREALQQQPRGTVDAVQRIGRTLDGC